MVPNPEAFTRRRYLVGTAAIAAVAGCTSTDDDSGDGGGDGGTEDSDGGDGDTEPTSGDGNGGNESGDGDGGNESADGDGSERSDDDTLLHIGGPADLGDLPWDPDLTAEFAGEGSSVTDEFRLEDGMTAFVYDAEVVDDTGLSADVTQTDGDSSHTLAINEVVFSTNPVMNVSGGSLIATDAGQYLADLDAAGTWELTVAQLRAPDAEIRTPPVSISGTDSAIVGPVESENGLTVAGNHEPGDLDDYSFNVVAVPESATGTQDYDFAFTEDGGFEGESRADVEGTTWLYLRTKGDWTLEIE